MAWRSDGRSRRRRARRPLVALVAAAGLLGLGGAVPMARAQDGGTAITSADQLFGSYDLQARGLGVEARYEIEGLLPGGSPVLDLTVPETVAKFGAGPTGYGLASIAYPGGLLVNLGSLIAQTGQPDAAASIPDYPVKAEAFFPSGPVDSQQSQAGATEDVRTNALGVSSAGTFPGVDANPVIHVDSISSTSRTSIEDGKAVARTRVVLGGVSILGGVVTIGALTTDLAAVHDGTTGMATGGTTATGVHFLGLAASLTKDGLVLDQAPAVSGVGAPLGSALHPLLDPLKQLTAPVQALLKPVLTQAVPSVDDVLANAGVHLQLLAGGPVTADSGASGYQSSGLSLTFSYLGKEQAGLVQLINSIPASLRPDLGPLPNPISFLVQNHLTALTLGQGTVSALASAPFDVDGDGSPDTTLPDDSGLLPSFDDSGIGDGGFTTDLPELPPPASGPSGGQAAEPIDTQPTSALDTALPMGLLLLLVLAAPFLGLASTRLADNVLAPVSTSCPSGLDEPPSPKRHA